LSDCLSYSFWPVYPSLLMPAWLLLLLFSHTSLLTDVAVISGPSVYHPWLLPAVVTIFLTRTIKYTVICGSRNVQASCSPII
jgi:hypothetical protein